MAQRGRLALQKGTPGSCSPGPGGREGSYWGLLPRTRPPGELGEVSDFLCLPGQAAEPRAATPKEVAAGGWKEGRLGEGGGGEGQARAGHF